jgi:hypothetical protein
LTFTHNKFDEYFSRALAAQSEAEQGSGAALRRRFCIAGAKVDFRLASPTLAPLFCDALAHLETDIASEPDLTIRIWDQHTSGIGAPPPFWTRGTIFAHGEIVELAPVGRYLQVVEDQEMVCAASRETREAVVWLRYPEFMVPWRRAAPLLNLINWFASDFGYFYVHAASVGRPDGGVLIVGPSGAGKSHTATACLNSDLLYVADDHCLFGADRSPRSVSIYSTAKLYDYDVHRFPILKHRENEALRTEEGKLIFFLQKIARECLCSGFPIRAVVLPTFTGGRRVEVVPAPASLALLAIGPDNVLRAPSVGRNSFQAFAAALRTLPCFRLHVGSDVTQIPAALTSILDNATTRDQRPAIRR